MAQNLKELNKGIIMITSMVRGVHAVAKKNTRHKSGLLTHEYLIQWTTYFKAERLYVAQFASYFEFWYWLAIRNKINRK